MDSKGTKLSCHHHVPTDNTKMFLELNINPSEKRFMKWFGKRERSSSQFDLFHQRQKSRPTKSDKNISSGLLIFHGIQWKGLEVDFSVPYCPKLWSHISHLNFLSLRWTVWWCFSKTAEYLKLSVLEKFNPIPLIPLTFWSSRTFHNFPHVTTHNDCCAVI